MIPAEVLLALMWGAFAALGIALGTWLVLSVLLALADLVDGWAWP